MSDLTKHAKGRRMPYEQDIEQIKKNKEAIEELVANKLTAGSGIVIEDNEVSVDEEVVALKDELPAEVEAITPTGTENALQGLKIGDTSYKVGGGDLYLHKISLHNTYNDIDFNIYSPKANAYTATELSSMTIEALEYRYSPHLLATYFTADGASSIKITLINSSTKTIYYKSGNNNTSALSFTYTDLVDSVYKL